MVGYVARTKVNASCDVYICRIKQPGPLTDAGNGRTQMQTPDQGPEANGLAGDAHIFLLMSSPARNSHFGQFHKLDLNVYRTLALLAFILNL